MDTETIVEAAKKIQESILFQAMALAGTPAEGFARSQRFEAEMAEIESKLGGFRPAVPQFSIGWGFEEFEAEWAPFRRDVCRGMLRLVGTGATPHRASKLRMATVKKVRLVVYVC